MTWVTTSVAASSASDPNQRRYGVASTSAARAGTMDNAVTGPVILNNLRRPRADHGLVGDGDGAGMAAVEDQWLIDERDVCDAEHAVVEVEVLGVFELVP